jgi:hypothetical protein
VGEIVTGDSGSDPDNVCAALASGPFAARFKHWRNAVIPYRVFLIPCVWDSNPFLVTGLKGMIGAINNAAFTIDGEPIDATEARFDGIVGGEQVLRRINGADTNKYLGYMKVSVLTGGWLDGTLQCARIVPVENSGNSGVGLPSAYTIEASVIQLYDYERVTFRTLNQLCPNCIPA